ncbi:MAG: MOSC domain-containing protein YiiM [Candidatus Azotimanducaceae bacterium]
MRIISVNIGKKSPLAVGKRETMTGIFKQPVDHAVEVKLLGITGDKVLDSRHHGGPDQALYLYRAEDYEFWTNQLDRAMPPGMFGENLTIAGLSSPGLNVGDRLRLPNLLLEITAPRIPCGTLAARMGDPGFAKAFVKAERPGFYVRVIKAGTVSAGDRVDLETVDFESVSTVEFYRDVMRKLDKSTLQRYLALPIDIRTRKDFETRLATLEASAMENDAS